MNNLNYNVYTLDYNLEDHEFILQLDNTNSLQNFHTIDISSQIQHSSSVTIPWKPTKKLNNLHKAFQQNILNQYPCLPCSYCGYLLYPNKAKWIPYKENILYPLKVAFPRSQ